MANKIDTIIECSDLTKYYRTPYPLNVLLRTPTGALGNKPITITIHGVTYNRTTKADGSAKLDINLAPGTYTAVVNFAGDDQYNASSKTVTVTVNSRYFNVDAPYLIKDFGGDEALVITIKDLYTSTPVVDKDFSITIHGVTYNRTTDSNGQGKLNINLLPDVYSYTVVVPSDEGSSGVTLVGTVKVMVDTFMDGTDIFKFDDETVVYQCAVYDPWGRVQANVRLTVNGVEYIRHTDAEGLAKLNIRLGAGEYTLKAEYAGDNIHHPSSVTNRIISKARMAPLTTTYGGLSIPGNNRGFMESQIRVTYWDADKSKEGKWYVLTGIDTDMAQRIPKPFTSYEITETDPRVKTAKFTTNEYFDLTLGRHWVYITSPYHENFGGPILKVDYDKSTGLYTYQCQDGRRQYQTKIQTLTDAQKTVYQVLEHHLIFPNYIGGKVPIPITEENRKNPVSQKLLSGLHPLKDYDNLKSGAVKFSNKFNEAPGEMLSFDSLMDVIMNLAHYGQFPTDVYFTPDGICHIDPINLDAWLKTGFYLTHTDLAQYKYGFDITNVITAVGIKSKTGIPNWYGDGNLQWYFGYTNALVDQVTTQTTTESSGGSSSSGTSTGSNKGKTVVIACDTNNGSDSNFLNTAISKLQSAGYTVENLGIGPGAFSRYDWSAKSKGKIGVFIIAASTVAVGDAMSHQGFDYVIFGIRGDIPGTRAITGWNSVAWGRDADCNSACNGWAGLTAQQISDKMGSHGCLVPGNNPTEMANNILAALNGDKVTPSTSGSTSTSTSTDSQQQTTTVVDEVATYNKAMEKLSESARSMLSFEIKLPLNHTMFKELHTNQFLWTQLPREFKLANLEKIFKILPTNKINRGVPYVENRWYVEKIVTKMDSSGLFATITLNPFPSDYSVYANGVKGYLDAFNQAFRQQETTTSSTTTSTGAGQARLGKDSTDTNSMACKRGASYGDAGTGGNYDSCAQKGYAQQGRKYYEWARKYSDPISLAKALAKRFSYEGYSGNHDANAEVTHNNGGTIHCNCYDACRLVKCCFDAAGLDCIVVTGSIYDGGHGWNSVKYNGKWYSFDLCYEYTAGTDQKGSNALRKFF